MYRWGSEPIRAGVWYCYACGPVEPVQRVVPACPCGRMAMLGVRDPRGLVVVEVPGPKTCPNGHDLTRKGSARLSRKTCRCSLGIGHATWTCSECDAVTMYPPCTD